MGGSLRSGDVTFWHFGLDSKQLAWGEIYQKEKEGAGEGGGRRILFHFGGVADTPGTHIFAGKLCKNRF